MRRRRVMMAAALAALMLSGAGCRSTRRAATAEDEALTHRRVVCIEAYDSMRLVAVVALDSPQMTLNRDSTLSIGARRATARIVGRAASHKRGMAADSAVATHSTTQADVRTGPDAAAPWRRLCGAVALAVILLSLTGIRSRR